MLYYDGIDVSKVMVLMNQVHQKNLMFDTIGII